MYIRKFCLNSFSWSVVVADESGKKKYVYIRNRKSCNQYPYVADGEKALNNHLFNEHSMGSLCSEVTFF